MEKNLKLPNVLLVDDLPENLIVLERLLKDVPCQIFKVTSGNEALSLTLDHELALILADINMPEMNGYEMLKLLRSQEKTRLIPVIFLTAAYTTEEDQFKGYEVGAVDFILKPLNEFILLQKVKFFLELFQQRKDLELAIFERHKLERIIHLDEDYSALIGQSECMKTLFRLLNNVVRTDATVLIQGESGTGKELVAKAIHQKSHRNKGPFIRINCAALPESLLESELFGHEKGAFTGADDRRLGRFELADGGTLFIDEIGELSLTAQVKLLRVLQEKEIERVGGGQSIPINVRIVAATNRDLEKMMNENKFREDLFYRLNEFPILMPPLRVRGDDIILLAEHFLALYGKEYQKPLLRFDSKAIHQLRHYSWKGNIRELKNVVSRAVLLCDSQEITEKQLFIKTSFLSELIQTGLDQQLTEEQLNVLFAKAMFKKLNENKKETARILNITYKTLVNRLES